MKRVLTSVLASATLMLVFGVAVASADSIPIISGNAALGCCPGPYANADITFLTSTTAQVTFTSASPGEFLFGDSSSVDLNVNATTFTATLISGTNTDNAGFTPGPYTANVGAGQEVDGWGKFNLTIDSFDGYTNSATSITFLLTSTSGPAWASAADVTTGNAGGLLAAAHIFVCAQNPCDPSGSAKVTGYAAGNGTTEQLPPPDVPEPGSLVLLGSGLLGAAALFRRRFAR